MSTNEHLHNPLLRSGHAWSKMIRSGLLAAALLGGLTACGGGDDEGDSGLGPNSPTPSPVGKVSAVDGYGVVRPGMATRVDLSAFVRGPGATLASMGSEQPGCAATNLSELSAEITNDSGLCEFTYTVSNSSSTASADINVLASSSASPLLPPLSQSMTLDSGPATYDLPTLLGSDWPAGYSLDPASVDVQGGSVQGSATASGNTLTYTPPSTPDWNRIVFILKDPTKPDQDALGTLYVTVSDSVNQPPVIGTPKYDHLAQSGASSKWDVVTHQTITLDLGTLPNLNITDPEGQEWQLVEVQSYSASVVPVDPNSVTNKQFTFTSGLIGEHIVSYIVGDHEGGFTSGLIKILVGPDEPPKTWSDIGIGDVVYQATPHYSEVIARSVIAEGVWDSGVGNTIAGVSELGASAYCSNGNHLATKAELDTLLTTPAADGERSKYPVQRTYVVSDGAGYLTYDLISGATAPYVAGTTAGQYVMCVANVSMSYAPNTSAPWGTDTAINDGAWWPMGVVTSTGGVQGSPVVVASVDNGSGVLTDANVRLTPAGCPQGGCTLEVQGSQTQFGDMTVRVTNALSASKTMDIGPLRVLQNAKVASARTGSNNNLAGNGTPNTVLVTVSDKDNYPVAYTDVKLRYTVNPSSNITVTPASGSVMTTDANGDVQLSLASDMNSSASYTLTFDTDAISGAINGPQASVVSTFKPRMNAKVTDIRIGVNNAYISNRTATNTAIMTVRDSAGNLVRNTTLKIQYSKSNGYVTITPASGASVTTNSNGEVTYSVVADGYPGYVTVSVAADAVVDGLQGSVDSVRLRFATDCAEGGRYCLTRPDGVKRTYGSNVNYCSQMVRNGLTAWDTVEIAELSALYQKYPNGGLVNTLGWPNDWVSASYRWWDYPAIWPYYGDVGYMASDALTLVSCGIYMME